MAKRILIVDDDADDRNFMTLALGSILDSYDFTCANNGQEAIGFLKTGIAYDLIFLDLNMPLMDGYETLEAIKKNLIYKNVPVIVISNSKSKFDIDRCKRLGASDYIIKPDNFLSLIGSLKDILVKFSILLVGHSAQLHR